MTDNDARKILAVMMTTYPTFNPADVDLSAAVWSEMLADYTYEQVSAGLKSYIRTDKSGFAPSIGQIIANIQTFSAPDGLTEMEAWALVSKALRNSYYNAEKEFAALPPVVQKAVGDADNLRHWAQTDMQSIETVIQSNFLRTYRVVQDRERTYNTVSPDIRAMIDAVKPVMIPEAVSDSAPVEVSAPVPMPEGLREKFEREMRNGATL